MEITVEEKRLPPVSIIGNVFDTFISDFSRDWLLATSLSSSQQMVYEYSIRLWEDAKSRIRTHNDFDDRPIYWTRLAITRLIRTGKSGYSINNTDRKTLIEIFEKGSRGMANITFPENRNILRVLISGFDPFGFVFSSDNSDCNISGANVLLLDGTELSLSKNCKAYVKGVIFPVRYEAFDAGLVETFFSDWMSPVDKKFNTDMIITSSLGHDDFNVDRFPARCRLSQSKDNLDVAKFGLNEFPKLQGVDIAGPSFVESSLPVQAFLVEQLPYEVHDNRLVSVFFGERKKTIHATSLAEIVGEKPLRGSGGNFLSNEISYRTLLLRDTLKSKTLPVGHIHLPTSNDVRLPSNLDTENAKKIVDQFRTIVTAATDTLHTHFKCNP